MNTKSFKQPTAPRKAQEKKMSSNPERKPVKEPSEKVLVESFIKYGMIHEKWKLPDGVSLETTKRCPINNAPLVDDQGRANPCAMRELCNLGLTVTICDNDMRCQDPEKRTIKLSHTTPAGSLAKYPY